MTTRFSAGVVPAAEVAEDPEKELHALWEKTRDEVVSLSEGFQFHTGLERTMMFITATNAYIEKRAPWKLGKSATPSQTRNRPKPNDAALMSEELAIKSVGFS